MDDIFRAIRLGGSLFSEINETRRLSVGEASLANWVYYWILPGIFVSFFLIAAIAKTYPTGRAAGLFIPSVLVSFFFFAFDFADLLTTIGVWDAFLATLLIADLLTVAFVKNFQVSRTTERIASLAIAHNVSLRVENRTNRRRSVFVCDDLPHEFSLTFDSSDSDDEPNAENGSKRFQIPFFSSDSSSEAFDFFRVFSRSRRKRPLYRIPNQSAEEIAYRLIPNERGTFRLEFVDLCVFSFGGFWKKILRIPCESEILVYPNLKQLREYDLLARSNRLNRLGLRKARRVGVEHDFERLRDYSTDDQYKLIDWSATAKRNKLIVKEFQTSRNQRIVFMIDSGRMTSNLSESSPRIRPTTGSRYSESDPKNRSDRIETDEIDVRDFKSSRKSGKISLLDHSFNAMLMLAYIALRQGDEVGFCCFSNRIRRYIPPRAGMKQMNLLIHGAFDLFPEPVESRYDLAFSWLTAQTRKRSLLVLTTNVNDERNAAQIVPRLTNLVGRHLPLGLFFRDRSTFDPVERFEALEQKLLDERDDESPLNKRSKQRRKTAANFDDSTDLVLKNDPKLFYQAAAASEILNWRSKTIREISARGALTLDVFPEQATSALINKYLEIKARRLL